MCICLCVSLHVCSVNLVSAVNELLLFLVYGIFYFDNSQCKNENIIFQVAEEPKKVVPEKKIPVVAAKKPEPPPTKGTLTSTIPLWRKSLSCLF